MSSETLQSAGPLLCRLLAAQDVEESVVGYPQLQIAANEVIRRSKEISDCIVWPIGGAAERVGAAVTLTARGAVEVGTWNTHIQGRRVLVIVVAAVSALSIEAAAAQLRRRGALEVHGWGVAVSGADRLTALDSYVGLEIEAQSPSVIALVGDAA